MLLRIVPRELTLASPDDGMESTCFLLVFVTPLSTDLRVLPELGALMRLGLLSGESGMMTDLPLLKRRGFSILKTCARLSPEMRFAALIGLVSERYGKRCTQVYVLEKDSPLSTGRSLLIPGEFPAEKG